MDLRWKRRDAIIRRDLRGSLMDEANKIPNIRDYLESLRHKLRPVESVAKPAWGEKKVAAVLVPLMYRNGGLEVLYTRRSDLLTSHPGQVAFPGGRFDWRDSDLLAAALRETHEEVGIEPHQVRVLGNFPGQRTRATNIAVTPFVGAIEGNPELRPDPKEVAEIFTIPLSDLSDPRYRGSHRLKRNGATADFPAIVYGGQVIWGLTYTLTLSFLRLINAKARSPHLLPINSK
jgi:8-oxo-dGTP pyrophosphatase MutT (NUDIX family)